MFIRWILFAFVLVAGTSQAEQAAQPVRTTSAHQPSVSAPRATTSKSTTQEATSIEASTTQDEASSKSFYERLIAWGTIALVFVTGGLWLATYLLAREAKKSGERQDKALREIERAYIFVEVSLETNLNPNSSGFGNTLQVKIWNHGKTPAEIIQIRAYSLLSKTKPTALIESPGSEVTLPPGLAVAQNSSYQVGVTVNVTEEELRDIGSMYTTLYCLGLVRYRDIFGTERETHFCWFYRDHTGLVPFVIAPIEGLNRRT